MNASLALFVALILTGQSLAGQAALPPAPERLATPPAASPSNTLVSPARATDRIIVKYTSGRQPEGIALPASRMDVLSAAAGVSLAYGRPMSGDAHVLRLPKRLAEAEVARIAASLAALPDIESAEPDFILRPAFTPNDPQYAAQWHYFEAYGANLPGAWDITTGSSDVVVAVVDTGILNHADLAGRTVPGYDFVDDVPTANDGDGRDADPSDPGDWITADESSAGYFEGCYVSDSSWHGTHVAGTIGAASNNGIGVAGINWTSKILPVRVLGKCGGYLSDIIDGTRWAVGLSVPSVPDNPHPARVVNMSLGGQGSCDAAFTNLINEVRGAGATLVVAAGNESANASGYVPGNCSGVVAVAATNRAGNRAYYSNYGSVVDIAAPGGAMSGPGDPNGVLSTLNTGTTTPAADTYAYYQGTSMATPHVAGIASLMLSVNPALTSTHILNLLRSSATHFRAGSTCTTSTCGAGIVNANTAVRAALTYSLAAPAGFTVTARSQISVQLQWIDTSLTESGFTIERAPGGTSEWAMVAAVLTNTTSYVDGGLPCGVSFAYRARAYNIAGNSPYSAIAQAATQPCLLAGAVTDAATGARINAARIGVVDTSDPSRVLTATSNVSGMFALAVPERVFTVTVSKAGYRRAVFGPITVTAGLTATLNVSLEQATPTSVDVMLLIDGSAGIATRLGAVKGAASQLVDLMRPGDQIGVAVLSTTASVVFPLTHVEPVTPVTSFTDSMESGAGRWIADSPWGLTTAQYHSRSRSWTDSPSVNYSANRNVSLRLASPVHISATLIQPVLRFWQRYNLQSNHDYGFVEISTTGSLSWTTLFTNTGINTTWREIVVDLSAYKGQNILPRFRLTSDGSTQSDGWYIDDVFIGEGKVDPKAVAKSAIGKVAAKGYTSVGAGLQAGRDELAARGIPARPRAIILLGDALEDTPPFAPDMLAALRLDHIPIHAVGVSPDSAQQFLWQLAYETGGDYYFAPSPADLAGIYATIAGGMLSQQTLAVAEGSLAPGSSTTQTVWIGDDVAEALFSVDFANISATFELVVQSPDGIVLTSAIQQPGVESAAGDGYQHVRVRAPALTAGDWHIIVTRTAPPGLLSAEAGAADEPYQSRVSVQSSLAARFEVTSPLFNAGMPINLLVQLPVSGIQPGAIVTVSARSPSAIDASTDETVALFDDGHHADGQADDGVFAGFYMSPAEPGTYRFVASVDTVSVDGDPIVRRMETFVFLAPGALISPQVFLPIATTE